MAHLIDSEGYYYSVGEYITGGAFGQYAGANAMRLSGELLYNYNWTIDAISAWFGAITYESQFNPAQIEGNYTVPQTNTGVGYIQWTPSSQLISYCEEWGVNWRLSSSQLRKWELERTTNNSDIKQWFLIDRYYQLYKSNFPNGKEPPATFNQFTKVTFNDYTPEEMSAQIVEFYTRPASWQNTGNWIRNAEATKSWYNRLTGLNPPMPPGPGPKPDTDNTILTFNANLLTKPNNFLRNFMTGRRGF